MLDGRKVTDLHVENAQKGRVGMSSMASPRHLFNVCHVSREMIFSNPELSFNVIAREIKKSRSPSAVQPDFIGCCLVRFLKLKINKQNKTELDFSHGYERHTGLGT
jgi:hypothetical protein